MSARITVSPFRACLDVQRTLGKQRRIAALSDGELVVWLA